MKRKGLILVEILTVVFFATLIIMAAYSIYLISYKAFKANSQKAELTQNARIALERMTRDIRQAMGVVTVLPETPELGTPPSELKFQDGHHYWASGEKIQYITYYLDGTDLHQKYSHYAFPTYPDIWVLWSAVDDEGNPPTEYQDSDVIKAEKIASLQFWGNRDITIHLSVSDGSSTYYFQTISLGRNIQ